MILDSLYQAISDQAIITRAELAKRFALSEDGVDAMLSVWIKKGKVSRTQDMNSAGHVIRVRYSINRVNALSLTVEL